MSETEGATNEVAAAPAAASPKGKGKKSKPVAGGPKKPKSKPNHPPTSEMVQNAIKSLKERGGSSLQAIKKFVSATYKIDADKLSPFIKKYLKGAVTSGQLVQTKGKGASGSFRLPAAKKAVGDKPKAIKKTITKKASGEKKPKAVIKKSAASTKKSVTKKPAAEKKKAAVSAKSAKKIGVKSAPKQKPTRPAKSGAAKTPKAPKPKKAISSPAKKAAKK